MAGSSAAGLTRKKREEERTAKFMKGRGETDALRTNDAMHARARTIRGECWRVEGRDRTRSAGLKGACSCATLLFSAHWAGLAAEAACCRCFSQSASAVAVGVACVLAKEVNGPHGRIYLLPFLVGAGVLATTCLTDRAAIAGARSASCAFDIVLLILHRADSSRTGGTMPHCRREQ